ncbi:HNH endonuclease family protein [Nocardia uniformis]|uniref:HNH endonuclease family protein n=1 Tax=Nocardia uniformis TaxID=53432 RepID=UPI000AD12C92|nr:HNH endonuclease family protein [Nocardia uniformis]
MLGHRVAPAPGSPGRAQIEQLLAEVQVLPARPYPGGYERGCKTGQGCVFGPAWSDDTDAPGAHDGCDTRNNALARQLTEVTFRAGTNNCVVLSGILDDPYTSRRIIFDKADAKDIQIDHVYPLAAAWDMGASGWSRDRRLRFANDLDYNLLAVNGKINQDKSDNTPADWLPPSAATHCFYAGKYLTVAAQYSLPITAADKAALQRVATGCP